VWQFPRDSRLGVRATLRIVVPVDTIVVAALGDSITAGSPGWDPDPEVRARIDPAPDPRSQWEHWAAMRNAQLEFRNCGVYGERTDEIALRLDGCARGAAVLVVQGGINDIAQRRPVEPAAEHLRAMVRRGRELGLRVAIANVLPWNNGQPDAEAPIRRLNELVAALAANEGVPVLPFHETLEDPARPGRMAEAWTSDGDHPSVEGYRRLGELAFRLP
jgi:lysophospholipase L1-like esterase